MSLRRIIGGPSPTKTKAGARAPGMSSTKTGDERYFGNEADRQLIRGIDVPTNAHIGADAGSGVTHRLRCRSVARQSPVAAMRGWLDQEMIWPAPQDASPDRASVYPDAAIRFRLTIKGEGHPEICPVDRSQA